MTVRRQGAGGGRGLAGGRDARIRYPRSTHGAANDRGAATPNVAAPRPGFRVRFGAGPAARPEEEIDMRTSRALVGVVVALVGRAAAAETGQVLDEMKLRQLDGSAVPLFERGASATVLVFFRPDHERSAEALRVVAKTQDALAGKPVRWVGVAPGGIQAADGAAALAAAPKLTVLVDEGDALYSRLGIRTHPALIFVDRSRRVIAFEPFHPIDFGDIVRARVQRALGEITDAEVGKALAPERSQMPGEDPLGVASRHVRFGRKLLHGKAFAAAHENARKSMAIAPTAAAWALEGEIFAAEGKCAEAETAFASALKLDPREPAALAGRGTCR